MSSGLILLLIHHQAELPPSSFSRPPLSAYTFPIPSTGDLARIRRSSCTAHKPDAPSTGDLARIRHSSCTARKLDAPSNDEKPRRSFSGQKKGSLPTSREELQDVPEGEIESDWDRVAGKCVSMSL